MAKMSAVFAGTLLMFLVVTAVPASAVTTCTGVGVVSTINVGTDDKVVARITAGAYELSVNGGAFAACAGLLTVAATSDLLVNGSDAGAETFTFLRPADFTGENNIVDLGNGTDSLVLEYGGLAAPVVADPATADLLNFGTGAGPTLVGDMNFGGVADLRIDDADTITVNGGGGDDFLDAGNLAGISGFAGSVAANNIPAATNPFSANLTLNGGTGDDTLVSGDGNDNFQGGPGADGVSYEAASGDVTVDLTAATGTGMGSDTLSDVQDATGGDFDDTITGNILNNVLSGGDGDDTIDGGLGDDTLNGNADDDLFSEGTTANGSDFVNGGADYDIVDLSLRTSSLYIEPGAGSVSGQGGCPLGAACEDDSYDPSNDEYWLGSAVDTFEGSGSDEWVTPGAGDDIVDGNGGLDYLDVSDAAGPAVFNLITGTATGNGTDAFEDVEGFSGTDADDTLITDGTEDTWYFGVGGYDFFGWDGVDTVDASAASALNDVEIYLDELGTGRDVENAIGGAGDDIIDGNTVGNNLMGGDGFDDIFGDAANDTIEGGTGNDILNGGDGGDTLIYKHSTTGMVIDNQLGFTQGIGGVGDGEDSIAFFEIVKGSDFADQIWAGQTFLDANNRMFGRKGNDMIVGSNSSDLLKGGGGNDDIRAGGGDDTVNGAGGNDTLFGSSGDDYLKGGKGNDYGNGGKGADRCRGVETRVSC